MYVMIGDLVVFFFVLVYNKGICNYDVELVYEGLWKNVFVGGICDYVGYEYSKIVYFGGMKYYEEWGYVFDGWKDVEGMYIIGVFMILEYVYQDWCLVQMVKIMGKLQDYEFFMKWLKNYCNFWNLESGYM